MNLERLNQEIKNCKQCDLFKTRIKIVPGEGNCKADIMFIGEAPGKNEDFLGRPFAGVAGKLLDELLNGIELRREDIFIANILIL